MKKKRNKKQKPEFTAEAEMRHYEKILPPRKSAPGSKPVMIIDGMNMAYQAKYAYRSLSYKGKSTALRFGIPQLIKSLILTYAPEEVIVVWDGYKHPKRLEILPGYKSHREKTRDPKEQERFLKEVASTRKLLYAMGIPQVHDEAVEGDDMVYLTAKKMSALHRVVIVSGDKDFSQLVNWDISILNPRTKTIIAPFAFSVTAAPCYIDQFVDYLILMGDSSDDIPGVPGMGPVKTANFLKAYPSIKAYLESDDDYIGLQDKDKLKKIYKKGRTLIDLKYFHRKFNKEAKVKYYKGRRHPEFDRLAYTAYCAKYNLRTMLAPTFTKHFDDGQKD